MPAARTPPRIPTLILLSALSVLPTNMFLPSLGHIAAEFGTDYAVANLSIAAYAGVAAVMQLVLGPVSDRAGRRPVLLATLVVFALASLGGALAPDIWSFLGFRMLQGAVIAGYAVSLAVVRDTRSAREAASLIGYVSMAWAVAPLVGPSVGGLLDEAFGWRASFWTFAALGLGVLVLCWLDLGETNRNPAATVTDQLRTYPELVRSRHFWGYSVCMSLSIGAFYAFLGGAPLAADVAYGLSPAVIGVAMGSTTLGFVLGSFLAGRHGARHPLATTLIAGRIVACAALVVALLLYATGVEHALALFLPCMVMGMGNGLTLPSASAGAMSVRPHLAGSASGLSGALTVAGGAVVSALTGAVLTPTGAVPILLTVMLTSSVGALLAALYVVRVDRDAHVARPT